MKSFKDMTQLFRALDALLQDLCSIPSTGKVVQTAYNSVSKESDALFCLPQGMHMLHINICRKNNHKEINLKFILNKSVKYWGCLLLCYLLLGPCPPPGLHCSAFVPEEEPSLTAT